MNDCVHCGFSRGKHSARSDSCPILSEFAWQVGWRNTTFKEKKPMPNSIYLHMNADTLCARCGKRKGNAALVLNKKG